MTNEGIQKEYDVLNVAEEAMSVVKAMTAISVSAETQLNNVSGSDALAVNRMTKGPVQGDVQRIQQ